MGKILKQATGNYAGEKKGEKIMEKKRLTMKSKNGRVYDVHVYPYGDNNIEIVLVIAGLVMAAEVRPRKGRGSDDSYERVIKKADEQAEISGISID